MKTSFLESVSVLRSNVTDRRRSPAIVTQTFAALAVSALVIACGGSAPPAASATPPADVPASAQATDVGAPVSEPAAPAPADSDAAAAASAPAPDADSASKSASGVPEPKDECTPVGVDFEKRARPKLKECYATGKKKDPNLAGTIKIKMTIDVKGKIKSVKVIEKTLPDAVADCMLKVVKATPFPEVDKCWDASLTIPLTFPTPR